MFKYYNPNPAGLLIDDCAVRAICVVSGEKYQDIYRQINAFRRVTGAKKYNTAQNPHRFVEDVMGARKITFGNKISVREFAKSYPRGRYILDMNGHWSTMVDGTVYDTWDPVRKKINFVYEFSGDEYTPPNMKNQVFKYACTSEKMDDGETEIRIYDGNGNFSLRKIPAALAEGYIRCLTDENYKHIEL